MKRWFLAICLAMFSVSVFAAAKTQTRLILSAESARPGDTVWAGIEMKLPPKWHIYWRNGGDAGFPATVQWTLPSGISAGEIQWPIPVKLSEKTGDITLVTYVYYDEVILLVPLRLADNAPPGPMRLKANLSWQECEELCIQGHSEIEAAIEVSQNFNPSPNAPLLESWKRKLPQPDPNPPARVFWDGPAEKETRPALIEWNRANAPADFYPYASTNFEVQGDTEQLKTGSEKIQLLKRVKKLEDDWPKSLSGILVVHPNSPEKSGIEVALPVGPTEKESTSATLPNGAGGQGTAPLLLMILFGLLGGLILNVMPCVLPVIALKVLAFVQQSRENPRRVRRLGLVYGLGVLVSFAVLALLIVLVRHAGGVADWGMAFRNPQFRVIITVLVTLVALNLFGLFEITLSGRLMGTAGELTRKQGYVGAFFNGVLATALAMPCTAPFLGAATAFAFTQPPIVIFLVFLSIGVGLALPFVLLCWSPAWLKFLPRPGLWMERFKVAMGFPMLATAVWLFWITTTRMGAEGVLWFGLFLVVLALGAWIWGQFVQRSSKGRGIAVVAALLLVGLGYGYTLEGKLHWRSPAAVVQDKIEWKPWSPEAVEKARREGHPALVDFTADSCLNCQFNKLTSIEIPSTRAKLRQIGAATFIADYTDENPAIGKELQRYGRGGVPLVLVYPGRPDAPPIVLPPVLTPAIVLSALDAAAK